MAVLSTCSSELRLYRLDQLNVNLISFLEFLCFIVYIICISMRHCFCKNTVRK
uniref:Uncharacterized protein n=1 Tax=Anguilla anguilla TaxID=7936 RepID=A0A0E9PS32_ANGAN